MNPLRDRAGRRLAVARQDRDFLDSQVAQVMDHVVRFGANRVMDSDDSGDLTIDRHDHGGLAMRIKLAQHHLGRGIERDSSLRQQSAVADQDRMVRPTGRLDTALHTCARQNLDFARLGQSCSDRRRASSTTTVARGWRLDDSTEAASRRTSLSSRPLIATRLVNSGVPRVNVPVLSKANVSHDARASIAGPPLINTPCRASHAMLASMAAGVARTRPQGHATTSTATVRDQTSGQPAK